MGRQKMSNLDLRTVWQTDDPAVAPDVVTLWSELGAVFPKDRADRLKELVAVAYDGGKIVGACTARSIDYRVLRTSVFYFRPTILPGPQHDEVLIALVSAAKRVLQLWVQAHPGERAKGILVMFDSDAFDGLIVEPILRRADVELVLTGYTDVGRQIRVQWFDDSRLEKDVRLEK
jgi:hypothetical protein